MAEYDVTIPGKGTYTVEGPDTLSDVEAYRLALQQAQERETGALGTLPVPSEPFQARERAKLGADPETAVGMIAPQVAGAAARYGLPAVATAAAPSTGGLSLLPMILGSAVAEPVAQGIERAEVPSAGEAAGAAALGAGSAAVGGAAFRVGRGLLGALSSAARGAKLLPNLYDRALAKGGEAPVEALRERAYSATRAAPPGTARRLAEDVYERASQWQLRRNPAPSGQPAAPSPPAPGTGADPEPGLAVLNSGPLASRASAEPWYARFLAGHPQDVLTGPRPPEALRGATPLPAPPTALARPETGTVGRYTAPRPVPEPDPPIRAHAIPRARPAPSNAPSPPFSAPPPPGGPTPGGPTFTHELRPTISLQDLRDLQLMTGMSMVGAASPRQKIATSLRGAVQGAMEQGATMDPRSGFADLLKGSRLDALRHTITDRPTWREMFYGLGAGGLGHLGAGPVAGVGAALALSPRLHRLYRLAGPNPADVLGAYGGTSLLDYLQPTR